MYEKLKPVGKRIQDARKAIGMTQADLADKLDISVSHGQIIELYEDGGDFVMDVMDAEQTKGTHWHPNDVEGAVDYIVEFMEGKSDYEMYPFRQV